MAIDPVPHGGPTIRTGGYRAPLAVLAAALALGALGGGLSRHDGAATPASGPDEPRAALVETPAIEPVPEAGDLGFAPSREAFVGPLSRWAWTRGEPSAREAEEPAEAATAPEAVAPEPPRAVMTVPLPVPRPPEFRESAPARLARRAARQTASREPPAAPQPQVDDRSFLEKLFGVERPPVLAYAALESRPADLAPPRRQLSPPLAPLPPRTSASPTAGTAVYDITARTVTLPNGERLEAHSGLGEGFDDPRHVAVRMRGPTPPGTYDLSEREQPFHGVRAIRLTPVGGSEAIYGRNGLLAHTFMLGPRGDSNGCVSFRDYDRFLQAYLRGDIQRLVVVTGVQDSPPNLAQSGGTTRMARNGV